MRRRLWGGTAVSLGLVLTVLAGATGACDAENGLVGGACAEGYVQCGSQCVDISRDTAHCGSCGTACPVGLVCTAGACSTGDGAALDGSPDGRSPDGSAPDASDASDGAVSPDGSLNDAETDADATVADAETDADATVADAETDADATVADAETDATVPDAETDSATDAAADALVCTGGLTDCNGVCVDTTTDPSNCGTCNNVCASQLCVASVCAGTTAGSVTLIGHDYFSTPTTTAQARLLANAIFIPSTPALRFWSYEQYADPVAVARVHAIADSYGAGLGRTIAYTPVNTAADLNANLTTSAADTLIVYDQASAPDRATLATLGSQVATTLGNFVAAGGTVIVLDGMGAPDPARQAMDAFVSSANLFPVLGHTRVTSGSPVAVSEPGNVVGRGVLSPYGAGQNSASFALGPVTSRVRIVVQEGAVPSLAAPPVVLYTSSF